MMDPATATQVADAAFAIAETAFAAGKKLHTFVKKVKQIEEAAREFEREIKALGTACYLVGTSVKKILLEQAAQTRKTDQSEMLFTCLEQQLEDCKRSIDQLGAAIACAEVEIVNGSGCFMRAVLQIKLNTKAGDVEAARNLIRSHTSSLQLTLLGIAINVSYVIPKRVDANLRQQLDEIANKREELEKLRSQRTIKEDLRQKGNEDVILAVSEKVLSSGRTLYSDSLDGRSKKCESIFGRANFVSGWIQDANAIDSLAPPTVTEETKTVPITLAAQQKLPPPYTEDGTSTGRAGQGSLTNPGDEHAQNDNNEIDSEDEFAIETTEHAIQDGRAAFERQDFEEASESLQEALKLVRELPTNHQTRYDSFDIRYMLGVCAFHIDPPPVAKEALISIVENIPRAKAHSDGTFLQLQAGHLLAQTYVELGELEQARSTCASTLKGRRRVLHEGQRREPEKEHKKEREAVSESLALMATVEQLQGHASRSKVYSSMLPNDSRQALLGSFDHLTQSVGGLTSLSIATEFARIADRRSAADPDTDPKNAGGTRLSSQGSEASPSNVMTEKDVKQEIEKGGGRIPARSEFHLSGKSQDVCSSREVHQSKNDTKISHQPKTAHDVRGYRNIALRDLALSTQYVKPKPAGRSARKKWLSMLVSHEGDRMGANPDSPHKERNVSLSFFDEPEVNTIVSTLDPLSRELVLGGNPVMKIRECIKTGFASKVFTSLAFKRLYIWTSPLHLAALFGELKVVQALLKAGARVQKTCQSRITALHCAAMGGHCDIAKVLIEAGCPTNVESPRYGTPLALAVIGERLDVIDLLVYRDSTFRGHLYSFGTIAHLACMTGNLGLVKALYRDIQLLAVPSDVRPQWYRECRFLIKGHGTNAQMDEPSTARIERYWEVNKRKVKNCFQITPLTIAAYMGHTNVVEYLISLDCDANARCSLHDKMSETCSILEIACLTGHDSVVHVLLLNGVVPTKHAEDVLDPLYRPKDELWAAIFNDHSACLATLLHHGAQICVAHLLFVMKENKTTMMRIIVENRLTTQIAATALKCILAIEAPCGPDTNRILIQGVEGVATYRWSQTPNDGTLLHFVKHDQPWALHILQDLIDAGAEVDAPNHYSITPLMIAAHNGNKGVIKKLLSNRASINLQSSSKRRAVDYARETGMHDVVELFENSV